MADPEIREYLIGYLLDALDEDEQRLVEESLAVDESLRRELGLMSKALAPLDAIYEEHSPPPNLTAKTCEMVDAYREGILSEETVEKPVRAKLVFGGTGFCEASECGACRRSCQARRKNSFQAVEVYRPTSHASGF